MSKWIGRASLALLVLLVASIAGAQYSQDFETLMSSPGGVVLTGQDLYYLPAGSVDFYVYTYAGNALGLPANPYGGGNFIGGTGPGNSVFARAQRDVVFGTGIETFRMTYDFCCTYLGAPPSANNLGSYSIRYDASNVHSIHLLSWVDYNNPTNYNAFYLNYDASGLQVAQPGSDPGPAWENLELNHWYRSWTTIDLTANKIIEVGIIDLQSMVQSVFNPTDWYLVGGAGGAIGPPQSIRFFGGGSVAGNATAWDNVDIRIPTGACCLVGGGCVVVTLADCDAYGGVFHPDITCEPDPCTPSPTENTSWGRIKASYK